MKSLALAVLVFAVSRRDRRPDGRRPLPLSGRGRRRRVRVDDMAQHDAFRRSCGFSWRSSRPRRSCSGWRRRALRLGFWPAQLAALALPDELTVTVAVFSILVHVIGRLPSLQPMIGIAGLYYRRARSRHGAHLAASGLSRRRSARIAIAMVVFLVLVNQAQVAITVRLSFFNRDWFNAIQDKNAAVFWRSCSPCSRPGPSSTWRAR